MANSNWHEMNQRFLADALSRVRQALERYIARVRGEETTPAPEDVQVAQVAAMPSTSPSMPASPALTTLCAAFGLSPFERDVLLLCAGVDLDSVFADLCATAQGYAGNEKQSASASAAYPTFSLMLSVLPHAHWDALTPVAPLRRWQLIRVDAGSTLTSSPLRIDERILHYLVGVSYPDERLAAVVAPLPAAGGLVPSQQALVKRLVTIWSQPVEAAKRLSLTQRENAQPLAVLHLCGEDVAGKRDIAAAVCTALELRLSCIAASALPVAPGEIETFIRLWEREAVLTGSALLLDCDELDTSDAARMSAVHRVIQQLNAPLLLTGSERSSLARQQTRQTRTLLTLDVRKPGADEQRLLWDNALGALNLNGHVDALVAQFDLSTASIAAASAEALGTGQELIAEIDGEDVDIQGRAANELASLLWDACRVQARPGLEDLAQRIEPKADWHDLVLPEAQLQLLREVAVHVRRRTTVYETWGFGAGGVRGLGISALFAGVSGTGKTLAAEVLAHELRLDLYRIDLSSVVSKYIGETEKNLRRVFDAAEEGGAILLFDEADALFGKRSEVKDSHDRHANIEVSYLLQRMEAYRGLAILTTNLKSALDTAFLRRIRFIVHFPFPDSVQRAEIWRRILPQRLPTEGLDMHKLARLNVAGGNIRNIALNAAFLAADAHEPVRMAHLLRAASVEYAKLEKPLTDAEIGGWV